jgi:hypothetical protein
MPGTCKRASNCGVLFKAGVFLASKANVISHEGPIGGVKFSMTLPLARHYIWLQWLKKAIKVVLLRRIGFKLSINTISNIRFIFLQLTFDHVC